MKPWWQVATPHKDIREGRLDEAVFAADLSDVVQEKGPIDYRDPEIFFRKTYLTKGLENLIGNVLSRLSGKGKGEGVIQLQTPFGGGKTHALLSLYHAVKSKEKVSHLEAIKKILEENKLDTIPEIAVCSFVGTYQDPIKGKTPWGEIANQLGSYGVVKEHDQKRRAPGKELFGSLLTKSLPVLILMDELAEYVVKAKDFADQIFAFCQEITEIVKSLDRCCLVCTLPSSAPYGEEGERVLSQLQRISGRIETIYTPVEGEEIYEVIRKRLFEDLGSIETHKLIVDEYFNLYQRLGEDIPSEVKEIRYREKIKRAYPFHPELIDILFERWGTIPTFQRTRGVLRLMAEIISDLYKKEHPAPLIQPSHINFGNPSIRREFIKHIGNEFEGIVASDIDGEGAKSPRIDREMGTEYLQYKVATGLASSAFFYSFSGAEKKGITLPRLRLAFLREGIPPAIVGDAIKRLEDELWFLHFEKNLYCFKNQPNLNRVIIDKEEADNDPDMEEEIEKRIKEVAGTDFGVFLWPKTNTDIPDNKRLKLVILSPKYPARSPSTRDFIQDLLTRHSAGFRIYKNTLIFLVPDSSEYAALKNSVKRFLALKVIGDDKDFVKTLTDENKRSLQSKFKDADSSIPLKILSAYRQLAVGSKDGIEFMDMGIPTVGEKPILTKRVKDYLKDQERLLDKISPKVVMEKAFGKEEEKKDFVDIWEAFLKFPELPILENEMVLKDAMIQGAKNQKLGILIDDRIIYGEGTSEDAVTEGVFIIREGPAKELKAKKTKEEEGEEIEEKEEEERKEREKIEKIPPVGKFRKIKIRAEVPWDKLASFMSGVLVPLQQEGAETSLEVEVSAKSEEGISKDTLDLKVKETLDQIGAKILEWPEE